MNQKRFETIRKSIHFNNNLNIMLPRENDNYCRLHKLRPIITALCSKFQGVPFEQKLSVDEQLCATKAQYHMKQYMPAKPPKWGYKFFVLCRASGFSYNFEVYSGSENQPKFRSIDELDLGASSNTFVRLCRAVPSNLNHVVYFDNYYTSLPLMSFLAVRCIFTLSTVRKNRIPNCKLPSDDQKKKKNRGTSWEFVCSFDVVEVTSVA
ncbi:hypothetical protein NQ314_016032 [Rhamnusium bicolor]|uniref:PiggyBac transposable element-derived protein domain-containing protein n=1 Tax=Rhamnusium bicolor TaxID=1586634 RepID=A0AAV8WX74_9CUCU|nr:hypothetical protein NQ314_016032 [Rhamnusium bicolor]